MFEQKQNSANEQIRQTSSDVSSVILHPQNVQTTLEGLFMKPNLTNQSQGSEEGSGFKFVQQKVENLQEVEFVQQRPEDLQEVEFVNQGFQVPEQRVMEQVDPAQPAIKGNSNGIERESHEETQNVQKKAVLDHMARIECELDLDGQESCCLVSYHCEYQDYLDDHALLDPAHAKQLERREKERAAKLAEKQAKEDKEQQMEKAKVLQDEGMAPPNAVVLQAVSKPPQLEGEDLVDEPSEASVEGLHRYDNMIKSMLARLEIYNSLAPIQDYGRHQTKNTQKKKKGVATAAAAVTEQQPELEAIPEGDNNGEKEGKNKDYNEQFYDLDDKFIDDSDLASEELIGEDLLINESDFLTSQPPMSGSKMANLGETPSEVEYNKIMRRQSREDEKIKSRFKVLTSAMVDQLLTAGVNSGAESLSWNQCTPLERADSQPDKVEVQEVKVKQLPEKRAYNEAFPALITVVQKEEVTIETILMDLKQRVLRNESLHNFKKEINQLVELIEKKDPKMDKLPNIVGQKLASILAKPEQEMQFMLKRINLLTRKNQKKSDLEKTLGLVKQKIEATLKFQNKRSENDFMELTEIPSNFVFRVPEELKSIVAHYPKDLKEYVRIHNDYVKTKICEERAKAKHKKGFKDDEANKKYELLDFDKELRKHVVESLSVQFPENIRERLQAKYLDVLFGLATEVTEKMPFCGSTYHLIQQFPTPPSTLTLQKQRIN